MRKKLAIVLAAALTFNSFGAFADELAIDDIAIEDSFEDAEEFAEEEVVEEDDAEEEVAEEAAEVAEEVTVDDLGDELFEEFDEDAVEAAAYGVPDEQAVVVYSADGVDITYDDFDEALTAALEDTNDYTVTLTLKDDVTLTKSYEITRPVTIVLNNNDLVETAENYLYGSEVSKTAYKNRTTKRYYAGEYCRNDTSSAISFAEHAVNITYNWNDENTEVISVSEVCDNCGTFLFEKGKSYGYAILKDGWPETSVTESEDKLTTTYTFDKAETTNTGKNDVKFVTVPAWHAEKTVENKVSGYSVGSPYIYQIGGVNQYTGDVPTVKAKVTEISSGADVSGKATITVSAATEEELEKVNKDTKIKVYKEDGIVEATKENEDPTCSKPGSIIYKVVITTPDGEVKDPVYLKDSQAIKTTDHVQGPLYGYQMLVKSTPGYSSEALALEKAGTKTVVKVTYEADKKYYYWTWGKIEKVVDTTGTNTRTVSIKDDVKLETVNYADVDGVFSYRPVFGCDYEDLTKIKEKDLIYGEKVDVEPLPNATTKTENADAKAGKNYSECTKYNYDGIVITYECSSTTSNAVVKSTLTFTKNANPVSKDASKYSHVSGTDFVVFVQPTCATKGKAFVQCAVCEEGVGVVKTADIAEDKVKEYTVYKDGDNDTEYSYLTSAGKPLVVEIAKIAHTYGAYGDTDTLPTSVAANGTFGGDTYKEAHNITYNSNNTEATVVPTCEADGALYKYCTVEKAWVKEETIKATGHDLVNVVSAGTWATNNLKDNKEVWTEVDKAQDYTFTVYQQCRNSGCAGKTVVYHYQSEVDGNETDGNPEYAHVYGSITVDDQKEGVDCQTTAKVVYTVKDLKDTIGRDVVNPIDKGKGTEGPHTNVVTNWNWAEDYEAATVTTKCVLCEEAGKETVGNESAKVSKETAENGVTTYTATYGEETNAKKVYTFKNAEVTYDLDAIVDGNLVEGLDDYAAQQVPEVTVTINGTVIDPSTYTVVWDGTSNGTTVTAAVYWNTKVIDIKSVDDAFTIKTFVFTDIDDYISGNAAAKNDDKKVAKADKFEDIITTVTYEDEDSSSVDKDGKVVTFSRGYNPEAAYSVETTATDGEVRYAVVDSEVKVSKSESNEGVTAQNKIEELNYDLDKVEGISAVGNYYVYAQITGEGYTTYSGLVTIIKITKKKVAVYIDNTTVIEGQMPNFHMRVISRDEARDEAGDYYDYGEEIDIPSDELKITTVGGEELGNLKVGTYQLRAIADNYAIATDSDLYTAKLTVLAKDASTPEDQAAAESTVALINKIDSENPSVEDVQAARKAYDALSDVAKGRVDDATYKKLTDAEKEVKEAAAEAAKKAAIDAANEAAGSAEGAAEAAAVTPNAANLKAAADAVAAAEKAIADAKAAGATDADLAEATKATAIAKADQAAAAAVADPSKANVDAANAAVAAAKAAGATDNELTTALKNQTAAAAANKEAVEKAVKEANTAAQKAASTGTKADVDAAQAAIDAAKKAGATDAQLADANKNLKAGQEKLAASTAKKNATVKASKSTVKKGKKATVKITSDSTGKITVTAKNKKAKNKKFVKIKKNGKVVFTKKAKKGTYKFTVKVAAAGNYKATTKVIKIKVK